MKRLALFAPVLLAGCYTYANVDAASVRPGMGVRARVSAAAADRIAPLLGASDARVVAGTLIDNASGAMLIEVPTSPQVGIGSTGQSLAQRISIAPGELLQLESRKLDRRRTAIVVGAAAVIAGSVAIAALQGGPGLDRPPGGSSTDTKIPLWRLHF
jgi:hypothetical protein